MMEGTTLMIGAALRTIRAKKEVTQNLLAKRTGLTIHFLSRLENGKKGVSPQVAERIAEALGVPVSFLYLLGDRSKHPLVTDLKDAVLTSLKKESDYSANNNIESVKGHSIQEYQPV